MYARPATLGRAHEKQTTSYRNVLASEAPRGLCISSERMLCSSINGSLHVFRDGLRKTSRKPPP
jgi:hypothetical protein